MYWHLFVLWYIYCNTLNAISDDYEIIILDEETKTHFTGKNLCSLATTGLRNFLHHKQEQNNTTSTGILGMFEFNTYFYCNNVKQIVSIQTVWHRVVLLLLTTRKVSIPDKYQIFTLDNAWCQAETFQFLSH